MHMSIYIYVALSYQYAHTAYLWLTLLKWRQSGWSAFIVLSRISISLNKYWFMLMHWENIKWWFICSSRINCNNQNIIYPQSLLIQMCVLNPSWVGLYNSFNLFVHIYAAESSANNWIQKDDDNFILCK